MLPPPNPVPPAAILEAEMNALSGCLKVNQTSHNAIELLRNSLLLQNAVVRTGQVYGFYADTRRL